MVEMETVLPEILVGAGVGVQVVLVSPPQMEAK
jgi:hypothetical protein